MNDMKAIVITKYGEPEVLREERLPIPETTPGRVIVRVRAFGLNHAEAYFRRGMWGDVAKVSGIEGVGEVHDPGSSKLAVGQRVFALMGGMGRALDGSYAEYVSAPEANVVPFDSTLEWTTLAAIPESYATAWTFLRHNLEAVSGQVIVVRGGTSALGQAILNIARDLDIRVLATTRSREKAPILEALGAEPLIEEAELSVEVRRRITAGVDGVIDILGPSTLVDSSRWCAIAGAWRWRDSWEVEGRCPWIRWFTCRAACKSASSPAPSSLAAPTSRSSRFRFGDFLWERAERGGVYRATPAHVFDFNQIVEAHRLMESGQAPRKADRRAHAIVIPTSGAKIGRVAEPGRATSG